MPYEDENEDDLVRRCPENGKRCFSSAKACRKGMRKSRARLGVYLCEHCHTYHMFSSERMGKARADKVWS